MPATAAVASDRRWELYKLLSEPVRLQLLALAEEEELAIGELAELLGEGQPNVSRHVKPLKARGLLTMRKQGTRALVHLAEGAASDPVVADALASGRELCEETGSLERVAAIVAARDAASRVFFAKPGETDGPNLPLELPAYLTALAPLIERRRLAVDVGTGEGGLLDVLAPVFEDVIALDRSSAQLERARTRLTQRGYSNVELVEAELDDAKVRRDVIARGGADAVFASRVLHHAPRPGEVLLALTELAAPGGAIVIIDYRTHDDERMREHQADLWLGFDDEELTRLAHSAGLTNPTLTTIPAVRCGGGPDGHLDWQVLVARRPRRDAS